MARPAPGRRALAASGLVALALAAAIARPALAHAELRASDPAEGAVLPASPGRVSLHFTGPMRVTSLRLFDEAGRERPLLREGERAAAAAEAHASLPNPLPPGAYRVEYRGLSGDGHVGGGAVRFRVRRRPVILAALGTGEPGWAGSVAVLLRAAYYAGSLGGAGLAFFALLFRARLQTVDALRLRRWAAGASLLGLVAACGSLAAQAGALTGGETIADAEIWGLVLRSRAGASYALGAAGLMFVATLAAWPDCARLAAAGGVLVCASYALLGHTTGGEQRPLLAGLLLLHLLVAAFWIGSLPPLAWAARREGTEAARLVRDWARLAMAAVLALLASGLLLAALIGGGARGLLGSRYGLALAAKASLVTALLGLAAWHRFRLTPALAAGVPGAGRRLSRSVAAEAALALLVLCAAAELVSTPPP